MLSHGVAKSYQSKGIVPYKVVVAATEALTPGIFTSKALFKYAVKVQL